ncbi:histidinol-phosphate transaminase [Desulfovermiculus halophilus]|uniref:histidinol-phosphate transaminase n=1 Tax=Desulfovermiculus halophilus TaxID=339722 RepID=UPI00048059BD|nr:histidinol-phosphate transaminase [Desulfovermiculus halophilus]
MDCTPEHPKDTIRPELLDFSPYVPGQSMAEIRRDLGLDTVIKMASNENPLGTSPLVTKTVQRRADLVFRYPRPNSPDLASALGRHLGLAEDRLVIGNGSDEIIDLLIRVLARPGQDRILILDPSFSIYRLQARLCGVELTKIPLNPDFSFPLSQILAAADQNTAMVFLTNPDNPSGYTAPREKLIDLARSLPRRTMLIVDEAYVEFADQPSSFSPLPLFEELDNVVLLRTFSKLYGLAGLRLGYGIMPAWLSDLLHRVKLPFSVNLLAEAAGLSALEDAWFVQASRQTILQGRQDLTRELRALGWTVYPTQANFLLVRPACPARHLVDELLNRGYIIRGLESYGLAEYVRISIGTERENRGLVLACKDIRDNYA